MKNFLLAFFTHKELYFISISFGTTITLIADFFIKYTPKEIFGISISLWFLALVINIIDIHTGIKADTKRRNDIGEKFVFVSNKGWRAFEKIFIFTIITSFVYNSELEVSRLQLAGFLSSVFLAIKLIMFFYVVLIEVQSIGENEEVRYGKKGKIFILLDQIIEIVNVGITDKVKGLFNSSKP